ncbi:hypothetical protein NDU88_002367 [Pleurodeles waltl]|uniref:Uncharacterized protein n=1 Tax=Pleurodeles waltl TaxID=8319 RepID=A0AAV7Q6G1_PLEWA|nr:hypothetical protein NDU88_002367 [Pleurodeles waltl]
MGASPGRDLHSSPAPTYLPLQRSRPQRLPGPTLTCFHGGRRIPLRRCNGLPRTDPVSQASPPPAARRFSMEEPTSSLRQPRHIGEPLHARSSKGLEPGPSALLREGEGSRMPKMAKIKRGPCLLNPQPSSARASGHRWRRIHPPA